MRERRGSLDRNPRRWKEARRLSVPRRGIDDHAEKMKAERLTRGVARLALAVMILLAQAPAQTALAHASLVSSQPEDGAVLRESPELVILIFNEPVAPLRLQLIDRSGQVTPLTDIVQRNMTVLVRPPQGLLGQGTHALSWRVVSSDGHPVGGTLIFSVGQP